MHAKRAITPSTDTIMDNLRLFENLNSNVKNIKNRIILTNSSPIIENNRKTNMFYLLNNSERN